MCFKSEKISAKFPDGNVVTCLDCFPKVSLPVSKVDVFNSMFSQQFGLTFRAGPTSGSPRISKNALQYVLEFCGFGPFLHLNIPVLKRLRGNAPESVKSFIESRKSSIEEDTWFPLAAAFNSCYLADSKTVKKKCWC